MRRIRFIKGMGFFDALMLGIGFIIGSGIFIMPLIAAEAAGTYSLVGWFLGGVYSILAGLAFAEAAAKLPEAGGLYTYTHKAFGDFAGFFAGWTFWIGYWITIATEQSALGLYLSFLLPQISLFIRVTIGVLTGLVLTYYNFKGVKTGARIGDFFTVGKLLAIVIFVAGALLFFKVSNLYPLFPGSIAVNAPTIAQLIPAIGSATVLALWAYLGVEIITVPDEEIKNAKKTVPRAIVVAVLTVTAIYLIVSTAFLGAVRWTAYVGSQSPLAEVFAAITGSPVAGLIITLGGIISILGSLNAVILATSRIAFSMSRDGLFPKVFAKVHQKYGTPYAAMALQTVFAIALMYTINNFVVLASLAVFFTIVPYALSSFATFKLIRNEGGKLSVLHFKGTPIIAGIASIVLILVYLSQTVVLEVAAIMLFFGLLVFIERKKIRRL
ncbi:MAG: amino acid permease [Candidatus Micrarchaeota archaeon]|nr:amino acid permease [Candidatus Micrarchaeota archaeon]